MKIKKCCKDFEFYKKVHIFNFYKVGNLWANVPKNGIGLLGINYKTNIKYSKQMFYCPFCGKKIEENKKKKTENQRRNKMSDEKIKVPEDFIKECVKDFGTTEERIIVPEDFIKECVKDFETTYTRKLADFHMFHLLKKLYAKNEEITDKEYTRKLADLKKLYAKKITGKEIKEIWCY